MGVCAQIWSGLLQFGVVCSRGADCDVVALCWQAWRSCGTARRLRSAAGAGRRRWARPRRRSPAAGCLQRSPGSLHVPGSRAGGDGRLAVRQEVASVHLGACACTSGTRWNSGCEFAEKRGRAISSKCLPQSRTWQHQCRAVHVPGEAAGWAVGRTGRTPLCLLSPPPTQKTPYLLATALAHLPARRARRREARDGKPPGGTGPGM